MAEVQLKALGMDGKEGMARRADRDEDPGGKTPLVIVVKEQACRTSGSQATQQ